MANDNILKMLSLSEEDLIFEERVHTAGNVFRKKKQFFGQINNGQRHQPGGFLGPCMYSLNTGKKQICDIYYIR